MNPIITFVNGVKTYALDARDRKRLPRLRKRIRQAASLYRSDQEEVTV